MNLYIAGLYTSHFGMESNLFRKAPPEAQALRRAVKHHLESYHYIHKGKYADAIRADGVKVFLDSGAFSSFSLGVEVDIEAYAEFIKANGDIIEMASVLDAIGDPVGTYNNQKILERLGVEVLPCFHYGEPLDLCEHYVNNYPYITLGGMVPIPNNKLEFWLDEVWERVLTDKDGIARTKVHGFGLTSRLLMEKYPWYSVDSSSWVQQAANGNVVFPWAGAYIPVSDRSSSIKHFSRHYDTYPPSAKQYIKDVLEYYGLTLDMVREKYYVRWAFNAFAYGVFGEGLGPDHWRKPFTSRRQTLF